MKKNKFFILQLFFVVVFSSILYQACSVPNLKQTHAIKKLYNNSLSSFGWSDTQANQIIDQIGEENYNKVFKYIFIAEENIDLSSNGWEIIQRSNYFGIPTVMHDNNNQYIFFSEGQTPVEVYLVKETKNASL